MQSELGPDLAVKPYEAPTGGWGSVKSLAKSLGRARVPFSGPRVLLKQNKMTVSCASAVPGPSRLIPAFLNFARTVPRARPGRLRTSRVTPEFFAEHTV